MASVRSSAGLLSLVVSVDTGAVSLVQDLIRLYLMLLENTICKEETMTEKIWECSPVFLLGDIALASKVLLG